MATRRPAGAKPRDPEASKAAILEAARGCFAEASFEQVGLRAIADRAGVDAALIVRYFGSKELLFTAAVDGELDVAAFFGGDVPASRRFAEYALGRVVGDGSNSFDPMLALLRSASSPVATRIFRELIETRVRTPLARQLGGSDAGERAALIAAFILGIKLLRDVLGDRELDAGGTAAQRAAERGFAALVAKPLSAKPRAKKAR